jgi:hypothetical protein
VVDLGSATGTVESVGLRVTRLRDNGGTLWYARNGEILRVGNHSQGFAQVTVDLPVPYGSDIDAAGDIMQAAADDMVAEPEWAEVVLEEPQLLGVEKIEVDKVVLRLTVKVRPAEQWRVARTLRQRIADRLDEMGVRRGDGQPAVRTEPARDANAGPLSPPPVAAVGAPPAGTLAAGTPVTDTTAAGTPAAGTAAAGTPSAGTPAAGHPLFDAPAGGNAAPGTPAAGNPLAGTAGADTTAVGGAAGGSAADGAGRVGGEVGTGARGEPIAPVDGAGGRPPTGPTDSERHPS